MLGKRQSLESNQLENRLKNQKFLDHNMPELADELGRMKYYKDYEFAKKQSNLLQYWRRAINIYFKQLVKGFATHWSELIETFDINGSRPLGLAKIILELSKNKEVVILKDETDFKKIANVLGNGSIEEEGSGVFWGKLVNFFKGSKEDIIADNAIIVHIGYLNISYNKVSAAIRNVFGDKLLIEENDFHLKFANLFDLNPLDQKILVHVLLDRRVIYKHKDKKRVFYCLEESGSDNKLQFDIEKEEILLDRRIDYLYSQIDSLSHTIEVKTKEALDCKRKNKKAQALAILTELRHLKENMQKFRTEKLFIEKIKYRLIHTHSQKEFADVLKDVNKILSDNENIYEEIIKNHDQMKDLEEQNEYVNHLINSGGKDDDLEGMYKDLNELSVSKAIINERVRHSSIEEERKDSTTSDAMRRLFNKSKESKVKPAEQLTESEVILKRFTHMEE